MLFEWLDVERLSERPRFAEHDRDVVRRPAGALRGAGDRALRAPTTARATPRSRRSTARRSPSSPRSRRRCRSSPRADLLTLSLDEEHGGLQVPRVVASACMAWFTAANIGTAAYSFLTIANAGAAARARLARAGRALRRADAGGPLLRHHDAVRAARRLEPRRRRHPRGARRRRHLPDLRQQDVDLRRRPRDGRQHRPPGAGQAARRACRLARHLAVHRAEAPRRTRTARSASATTSRWPASTTSSAAAARSTPRRSSATAPSRRVARRVRSATSSASPTRASPTCST